MKILFLQKVDNACGGIANVNVNLMSYFLSMNYQVDVLSLRHGDTWECVSYPEGIEQYVVNEEDVWGCPRLKELVAAIKSGNVIEAFRVFGARIAYKKQIAADYEQCMQRIETLAPDVIINSHYELLEGISDEYLKKTIMHFHTSFDQVMANHSYLKTFKQYAPKIYTFVWLSEKTKNEAMECGFMNSRCIYNPLPFSEARCADMANKKMIFMGRLASEKRVDLAIRYFREVICEADLKDWVFEIYGAGELADAIEAEVQGDSKIFYKGRTENVNDVLLTGSLLILTSEFEGMPLVVLEANECGVPVLAYDFGESSHEVIQNGKTGLIIPQDDEVGFKEAMKKLFTDEAYRRELSIQAKRNAASYTIQSIGLKWLELFREMGN